MQHKVINTAALLTGLILAANSQASDTGASIELNGLGVDGLSFLTTDSHTTQIPRRYAMEFGSVAGNDTTQQKLSPLQFEIDYQDKTADLFSPHHSLNTEFESRMNNSSREYKTRMNYQLDFLTPNAAFKYSPDSYGMGRYINYELGVAIPVKDVFSLETHYGWNLFDRKPEKGGMTDYQDWSIGVSTTYRGMKFKLDYIDINADEKSAECSQSLNCEGKTVFSIIKHF